MTYPEFNKRVFEFYLKRATFSFFTLSIDDSEFQSLADIYQLHQFKELKQSWSQLLRIEDGIPQYFGLLAVQCYAASIMHDDGANASDAYQIRLRNLLNLSDNNQLQLLFSGSNAFLPPQEEIWSSAKNFLKKKFSFDLEIPKKTKYAGRYVQYPKSQALLTTEDLRTFTVFFSEEFRVNESLSLTFFEKRISACLPNIQITNRVKGLFSDVHKRDRCIKQIFNFYNNWTGEIYYKTPRTIQRNSVEKVVDTSEIKAQLILVFSKNVPKFYLLGTPSNYSLNEILIADLFKTKSYSPFYSDLVLFTQSEYYLSEYEESRFLHISRPSYILVNKFTRELEFTFLEINHQTRVEVSESYLLYRINLDDNDTRRFFEKYIQQESRIKLSGGIRASRKREYLVGYGPTIKSENNFSVIYNFGKHEYNPETSTAGSYKIRVDNSKDIEFSLIDPQELKDIIPSKSKGWVFANYTFGSNPDIEGCLVFKKYSYQKTISIRHWISVNCGEKYDNDNILLRVINNSQE